MPHVILVEPHAPEQRRFLRGLRKVGAMVTGIGALKPDQIDVELRHLLDAYETVPDLSDRTDLYAAVRKIQDRGPWVDRLEVTLEHHLDAVAEVREVASIPGVPHDLVSLTRDKVRLKAALQEADIYSAPVIEIESVEQAARSASSLGFPLVLKPRAGSGVQNVHRVDDLEDLKQRTRALLGDPSRPRHVIERFADGHEGYFDGLICDGRMVFAAATHFYPSVLSAMRDRSIAPIAIHTNRLAQDGYDELRSLNHRALSHLGLLAPGITTATHLEWFAGREGMWFSELGLHPPPDGLWELYCEARGTDLYAEWARALCYGTLDTRPHQPWASGLVSVRPNVDGTVTGYEGIETVQRRYGERIFRLHLPPPGTRTQPIDSGYLANAYVFVFHENYDILREILEDIGRTLKMNAAP